MTPGHNNHQWCVPNSTRHCNQSYCWTQGCNVDDNHTRAACEYPYPSHHTYATCSNLMVGSMKSHNKVCMGYFWRLVVEHFRTPHNSKYSILYSALTVNYVYPCIPNVYITTATTAITVSVPNFDSVQLNHIFKIDIPSIPYQAHNTRFLPEITHSHASVATMRDSGC